MKSAWNIMSHFSSYKEWVLLTKNCTKSPSRSMLSGKLSRKLSRKLKKMMFDGPFLIRIAVRPLESTDKQKTIKNITCSILENPRRNRLSGRRAGCFETVQNISAENLSFTKQDRFEIHISTKKYIFLIPANTWSSIKVWMRSKGVKSASVHPARKAAATKEVLELIPCEPKIRCLSDHTDIRQAKNYFP